MIIGIGCDIVKIERIQKAMGKPGFLNILSEREKALCKSYTQKRLEEWVAGRFAAKEAIIKALHTQHNYLIKDIEILSDEDGAPYCTLHDYHIHISIAHEHDYAIAYALAETKE